MLEHLNYFKWIEEATLHKFLDTAFGINLCYHVLEGENVILLDLDDLESTEADLLVILAQGDVDNLIVLKLQADHTVFGYADDEVLHGVLEHLA